MRHGNGARAMLLVLLLMIGQLAICLPTTPQTSAFGSRIAETGYWVELPPMNAARYDHTMHLLQNDSLMVIGGSNGTDALSSIEIYNPYIGEWYLGDPLTDPRWGHASVTLQNSSILVIGGYDDTDNALSSIELYDTASKNWISLPDMPFSGANITAMVLLNGSVLVVGGNSGSIATPNVAPRTAIFDVQNDTWSSIDVPMVGGMGRRPFMLLNYTVLTVGGSTGTPWYDGVPSTELYDPIGENWTTFDDLTFGRYMFGGVVLGNGNVVVTGGICQMGPGYSVLGSTEVLNTTGATWDLGPDLVGPRFGHTATQLSEGEVLLIGGMNATGILNSTEVVQTKKFISVQGPDMGTQRTRHAAVRNSKGSVVVTGGLIDDINGTDTVEMFTPGVKEEDMALEVFGPDKAPSGGEVVLTAHTYNDTTGDIPGVLVEFRTIDEGSFDLDWGLTDDDGVVETVFHAPRNEGASNLFITITISAYKRGYKDVADVINLEVFPETSGKTTTFNDSIYHLKYVTTYGSGSPYSDDSSTHTQVDFLGDELVVLDGLPTVVANFSTHETIEKTFTSSGLLNHISSTSEGHYYYRYDMNGVIFSHSIRTTTGHVYNDTYENWYNLTETKDITYLPAKRGFDPTTTDLGSIQDIVNTYWVTTTTRNLDTGSTNTVTRLESSYESHVLNAIQNMTVFVGTFNTNIFLDETGMVYDHHSPELGILLQSVEYNDTGQMASNKVLIEFNDLIGEDPTSPLLEVHIEVDDPVIAAGTATTVRTRVTVDDDPVADASVILLHGSTGMMDPDSGTTGTDGWFNATYTAPAGIESKVVNISAYAQGPDHRSNMARSTITVTEDRTVPIVIHRPVTTVEEEEAVDIYIFASDDIGLSEMLLHYRIGGSGQFITLVMDENLGAYYATIPTGAIAPPLVQYYVSAEDINGNRAYEPLEGPAGPHNITVVPRIRVLHEVSVVLSGGGGATVKVAVRGNLSVNVTKVDDPGAPDQKGLNMFTEVTSDGDGELIWANISFTYRDPMIGDLDEKDLLVYRWDEADLEWDVVPATGVDTDDNIVWANMTSLSIFSPRVLSIPPPPPVMDTDPPTVTLTTPKDNARLYKNDLVVTGIATDNEGLHSIEVRVDDGEWINVWVAEGSTVSGWNLEIVLSAGEHTISARATDTSGNTGPTTSVDVMVFKENSTEGADYRFTFMALVAVVIALIITIYLLMSKDETADPDEIHEHHGPSDEDLDTWSLDDEPDEDEDDLIEEE